MTQHYFRKTKYNGLRYYQVYDAETNELIANLPSATTILNQTQDKSGIQAWRDRIGHQKADSITQLSGDRGTVMHRLIELYKSLSGTNKEKYTKLKNMAPEDLELMPFYDQAEYKQALTQGWQFFDKFYKYSDLTLDRVESVLAQEEVLWTSKRLGWAGTVDNVSRMTDGQVKIIDYKNGRKPKKETHIDDYYLQLACYWLARWDLHGLKADGAEIWLAHEQSDKPQIFNVTQSDFKHFVKEFVQKRREFYQLYNV